MATFDAWYVAQSEPMRIAVIGAVVASWSAIIASVIALLVAWVQARMARRAIQVQERAMFLSLIDRRARWFDDAMLLWSNWIGEQEQLIERIVRNETPQTSEAMAKIAASRREAKWLFGREVTDHLDVMENSVGDYGSKRMRVRELGIMTPEERREADASIRRDEFSSSLMATIAQQAVLADIVSPYLDVSDIKQPRFHRQKKISQSV